MRKIYLFAMALPLMAMAANKSKLTSNTIMDMMNREEVSSGMKMNKPSQVNGYIQAYIKYNDVSCIDSLESMGVKVRTTGRTILTASIPVGKIEAVAALESVECIEAAQPAKMMMDEARKDTRVSEVHAGAAPITSPFTGKGTIVGVIDGGVDFTHPAFFGPDGKTLRIKRVWCHDDEKGTAPQKFGYGSQYTTQESILEKGITTARKNLEC